MMLIRLFIVLAVTWASPAWALAISIDTNVNLALGTRNFGPLTLPDTWTTCKLRVDRTNWTNPAATMQVNVDISINGGPFVPWLGMTSVGGILNSNKTAIQRNFPAGTNRQLRGNYVVAGARFISTVTATCS